MRLRGLPEYTLEQIAELRARWQTPIGLEISQAILARERAGCDDGEDWPVLLEQLPATSAPWPTNNQYLDLRGICLDGEDLQDVRFSFVDVSFGSFKGCQAQRFCLQGSTCIELDLRGTNLKKADLLQIVAPRARFDYCDLTGAVMMCSELQMASFASANLTAAWVNGCNFELANLQGAVLEDLDRFVSVFPDGHRRIAPISEPWIRAWVEVERILADGRR
ncbi:uncharacterized protein YjbI with pentapeptide repeats [Pseudomonas nitritireducens]|uniref:Uncharacterized protein YjbI with pentapeptide repeats n=1 Tax=Pseudomonas nitroreducens TaxID=46680 RepID=A0A7W7KS91_PSENT|nr:pentapeptide repeat-containing protein [Pseudomonas nitritireducens]MBB4867568.1 uncharacterized protein YjbI with pentapeptide repeats [Pseudomonas nitritireducens]